MAHNWVSDHYRRNAPTQVSLVGDIYLGEDRDLGETLDEETERQRVRAALTYLTPDQRQVIILKFIEDWTNQDIAFAMDKSVGAIKALQHRALAALQRLLVSQEEVV